MITLIVIEAPAAWPQQSDPTIIFWSMRVLECYVTNAPPGVVGKEAWGACAPTSR